VRDVWHVTEEADRRWIVARLGPTPFKMFTDHVRFTKPPAKACREPTFAVCNTQVRYSTVMRRYPGGYQVALGSWK
jgi:hypothetical protein